MFCLMIKSLILAKALRVFQSLEVLFGFDVFTVRLLVYLSSFETLTPNLSIIILFVGILLKQVWQTPLYAYGRKHLPVEYNVALYLLLD